mmetsp:Transcript_1168/g.1629  ORF Transcript_1168/g.1629 Transcript_1168/m.1629 type:complete len:277 (-) Transcript_1168:204-1034(-)
MASTLREITVYEQGNGENKKVLKVPGNATMQSLMKEAAEKLKISLEKDAKLYFQNGSTVDDIELVRAGDVLALSCDSTHQLVYSVSVMGPGAVGKSAITLSYVQDQFVIDYDPTIEDAYRKNDSVDGLPCTLDILDTAGQDEYGALRTTWMRNRHGFVLVFSLADKNSYKELATFYEELNVVNEGEVPPLFLVGNKSDLKERKVSSEEGKELAAAWSATYIETSAKTGANIKKLFHDLVKTIRTREAKMKTLKDEEKSKLNSANFGKSKKFFCKIL